MRTLFKVVRVWLALLCLPIIPASIPVLASTTPAYLRDQCRRIGTKKFDSNEPEYARAVATVDRLTSALLAEGLTLRGAILEAMNLQPVRTPTTLDRLTDPLWGSLLASRIAALDTTYRSLTENFLRYDQDVAECVRQIGTGWETELFTRLEFALRAQQVSAERDTIRTLLDNLRAMIGSLENERNTRIARTLTGFSLGLAGFTLLLVALQIKLARTQNRLVREQTYITKRQEELNRALLAQKSNIRLLINDMDELLVLAGPPYDLRFSVFNSGQKAAKGFYNTVCIPVAMQLATTSSYLGNLSKTRDREIDGTQYSVFQNFVDNPVFPNRATEIGQLLLTGPPGEYRLFWQIATEDGTFPTTGGLGQTTLRTTARADTTS